MTAGFRLAPAAAQPVTPWRRARDTGGAPSHTGGARSTSNEDAFGVYYTSLTRSCLLIVQHRVGVPAQEQWHLLGLRAA